jgi:hypothetical protein
MPLVQRPKPVCIIQCCCPILWDQRLAAQLYPSYPNPLVYSVHIVILRNGINADRAGDIVQMRKEIHKKNDGYAIQTKCHKAGVSRRIKRGVGG